MDDNELHGYEAAVLDAEDEVIALTNERDSIIQRLGEAEHRLYKTRVELQKQKAK